MAVQATQLMNNKPLVVENLGRISYRAAWERQKLLQRQLIDKKTADHLLICEHEAVITIGRSTKPGNIIASESTLSQQGIEVIEIERGGDVTYHGPGQLVVYPILDLNRSKRDVGWYMRTLEEVIILSLAEYGIKGERISGKTGVWITSQNLDLGLKANRKIASIGVRISRWCTMHGFSLNVKDCSLGFSFINPCGYKEIEITSIQQEQNIIVETKQLSESLVRNFCDLFGYSN